MEYFRPVDDLNDLIKSPIGPELQRDPDVLDTWFSSGLWAFSTLGWPDATPELKKFYPTAALVTGFDIIFFWVARMMMQSIHFMDDVPFRDVYIHGLVLDEKGQKMSKTKGNVIDPLDLIDKYGADALRFAFTSQTAQGRNIRLSTNRVEGYRNFATKLWNAARFAEMNECVRQRDFDPKSAKQTVNRWIAGETNRAAAAVTSAIRDYKFNEAANAAYEFTWGTFCDWYVELTKPILNGTDEEAKAETRVMTAWVLDQILKILHPIMPFITEELWGRMVEVGEHRHSLLCLAQWPDLSGLGDADADAEIGWLIALISEIRSVRSEMNVPAAAKVPLVLVGASKRNACPRRTSHGHHPAHGAHRAYRARGQPTERRSTDGRRRNHCLPATRRHHRHGRRARTLGPRSRSRRRRHRQDGCEVAEPQLHVPRQARSHRGNHRAQGRTARAERQTAGRPQTHRQRLRPAPDACGHPKARQACHPVRSAMCNIALQTRDLPQLDKDPGTAQRYYAPQRIRDDSARVPVCRHLKAQARERRVPACSPKSVWRFSDQLHAQQKCRHPKARQACHPVRTCNVQHCAADTGPPTIG